MELIETEVPIEETAQSPATADAAGGRRGRKASAAAATVSSPTAVGTSAIVVPMPLDLITPDPAQARDEGADLELQDSIRSQGVLQPLRVYAHPTLAGHFMIEDGERRFRGAVAANLETVPVRVVDPAATEGDKLVRQLTMNDGKRLKPMEEARTFKRILADKGWSIQQLAEALGKSKSTVSDRVAMAEAPAAFQRFFEDGTLTAAAAPILRGLRDLEAKRVEAIAEYVTDSWEFRNAEDAGKSLALTTLEALLVRGARSDGQLYELRKDDKGVGDRYDGPVLKVGRASFATDTTRIDLLIKHREAAQQAKDAGASKKAPAEKPEPDKWQLEQRARERAHRRKIELRRLQFVALSEKLPTSIDGKWALFALKYLIRDVGSDTRRMAFKGLALPMGKKTLSGIDFSKELQAHAEKLDAGGRVRLILQLLIAGDLNVNVWGNKDGERLGASAALAKFDLKKVKIQEPAKPAAAAKKARR